MEENRILHSLKKDTGKSAQEIVGSDSVPEKEAIMLATMHNSSLKKRGRSMMAVFSLLFLFVAFGIFLLPKIYTNENTQTVNQVIKNLPIIQTDAKYSLTINNDFDLESYRVKKLNSEIGFSEIVINNGQTPGKTGWSNLGALFNSRFVNAFSLEKQDDYLYGIYKNTNGDMNSFLLIKVKDRNILETNLPNIERTLYTDLGAPLKLPKNSDYETLRFESNSSVRTPLKILRNTDLQFLMVYGFLQDNIILFTTNEDAFSAIKNRMNN